MSLTRRKDYTKDCPQCGGAFRPWRTTQRFCSRSCAAKAGNLGGPNEASSRATAVRAGIPHDAPRNKHGQRCVEKTCVICGQPFLTPPSNAAGRITCSYDCASTYKRGRSSDTRKGSSNPNYRHGGRSGIRDREGERRWYAAKGRACEAPNCRGRGGLALHHVIYRQAVERAGGDVWDQRNAMTLCTGCHMSHHRRGTVLQLHVLPDSVYAYAVELMGAGAAYEYLARRYAGGDPRLDALLA